MKTRYALIGMMTVASWAQAGDRPPWIDQPPQVDGYLYGVGAASVRALVEADARREADQDSRKHLAAQIRSRVQETVTMDTTDATNEARFRYQSRWHALVALDVDEWLTGAESCATYCDRPSSPAPTCFALTRLARGAIQERLNRLNALARPPTDTLKPFFVTQRPNLEGRVVRVRPFTSLEASAQDPVLQSWLMELVAMLASQEGKAWVQIDGAEAPDLPVNSGPAALPEQPPLELGGIILHDAAQVEVIIKLLEPRARYQLGGARFVLDRTALPGPVRRALDAESDSAPRAMEAARPVFPTMMTALPVRIRHRPLVGTPGGSAFGVLDLPHYRLGERIVFEIETDWDCYIKVFLTQSDGQTRLLFPNSLPGGQDNRLTGGSVKTFGDARDGFAWEITGPGGQETVTVVASERQFDDMDTLLARLARQTGDRLPLPIGLEERSRGIVFKHEPGTPSQSRPLIGEATASYWITE